MRENPLIIIWLDNLGVFYPLIGKLGVTNIAAAFEGGTAVRYLIGAVPSVTESAEVVVKAGCGDSSPTCASPSARSAGNWGRPLSIPPIGGERGGA